MSIPKIIHQSFPKKMLTKELKENISKIKKLNPNWEYRFYDDEDIVSFISKNYEPHILEYYNKINPKYGAARADLFRYLLIYKLGGVWLDIKSSINKPLDEVIKKDDVFLLSQWQNKMTEPFKGWGLHRLLLHVPGGEFQQWHIISAKENPLIKAAIEKVLRNIHIYSASTFGVGSNGIFITTGPTVYTLAIEPLLEKYPHRFVDSIRDLDLVYSIYNSHKNPNKVIHREIYKTHYNQLREPIIL